MFDRNHLCAAAGLAALVLSAATAAHAQRAEKPGPILDGTPAPSAQSAVSPLSAFSVDGNGEGTTASVKIGGQLNFIGQREGSFKTGSITFSAPVDDKKGFAAPLTKGGLGADASIKLQLSELIVPAADTKPIDNGDFCKDVEAKYKLQNGGQSGRCAEIAYDVGGTEWANRFDAVVKTVDRSVCDDLKAAFEKKNGKPAPRCNSDLVTKVGDDDLAKRYRAAIVGVADHDICKEMKKAFASQNPDGAFQKCDAETAYQVGGVPVARAYNALLDAAFAARVLTYYGVTGEVGDKSYSFYDPTTLAKSDVDRTPWSAGVFYSWIGGAQTWAIVAEYAHKVKFKEGDSKIACLAGAGPVLSCVSGSLERVKQVTEDVLSLEARWTPGVIDIAKAKFGIAPKIAYDANNDDWAVALPIYLFGSKTGLTGGVRADWDSRDHDIIVGVFVTKTFSITDAL